VRSQRGGVGVEIRGLLVEADVAVTVGKRSANERHVNGERLVAQQLAAIDIHEFDEIRSGRPVHPSAVLARIDEGAEADMGEQARPARADFAEELGDHAARQCVGLDLVGAGKLLHARRPHPVAADHAPDHALMREAVEAARLTVADAERVDKRKVARAARLEEAPLQRGEQAAGLEQPAATADERDRRTIGDARHRISGGRKLVAPRAHASPS